MSCPFSQLGGAPRKFRPISEAEAAAAFQAYYSKPQLKIRGPNKGQPRHANMKNVRTRDLNTTLGPKGGKERVIGTSQYLRNPHSYDYVGVDTGAKTYKPPSAKQAAWRAQFGQTYGSARKGTGKKAVKAVKAVEQLGGVWW